MWHVAHQPVALIEIILTNLNIFFLINFSPIHIRKFFKKNLSWNVFLQQINGTAKVSKSHRTEKFYNWTITHFFLENQLLVFFLIIQVKGIIEAKRHWDLLMINSSFWVYFWHCKTSCKFLITLKGEKTGKYFSVFIKLHQREEHKSLPLLKDSLHCSHFLFIPLLFFPFLWLVTTHSAFGGHVSSQIAMFTWETWAYRSVNMP